MTDRDRPHPDEELVERMERDLPARSKDEEEARETYQRLIGRIGDLDLVEPAPGWEDRAVERWRREAKPPDPAKPQSTAKPRRRMPWRPIAAAAAVAIVAALVLLILRRGGDDGGGGGSGGSGGSGELQGLDVVVLNTAPQSRQDEPVIDDTLRARVHVDAPYVELRVYRDQVLIARCPGDDRCRRVGAILSLDLVMDVVGQYEVIGLSSHEPLPPQSTRLDVDEVVASGRGARVQKWKTPITIR